MGTYRLLCVSLLAALLCACVSGRTYRTEFPTGIDYCRATTLGDCAGSMLHAVSDSGRSVSSGAARADPLLGFIEFDDQGHLRDRAGKDLLFGRIDELAEQQPLLIVVFAHGWKHNASASDTNVVSFGDLLLQLAAADASLCPTCNRRVVGLYLGWRGRSAELEPFKTLSFWQRKSRAHRIGQDGATEVLMQLAKLKARERPGDLQENHRVVLAGHSFGGALLYTAVHQLLLRDVYFPTQGALQGVPVQRVARNIANLIVLVNPAFEAARYTPLRETARGFEYQPRQMPVLALFTSETDTATGRFFPLGRSFSTLFSEHSSPQQREENRAAVGHHEPFVTHRLELDGKADVQAYRGLDYRALACAWTEFTDGARDDWPVGPVVLRRSDSLKGDERFSAFYVVRVDDGVISGHSDIWGPTFREFLFRFLAVQSGRARSGCR